MKKTNSLLRRSFPLFYTILFFLMIAKSEAQKDNAHDFLRYSGCIEQRLPQWVSFWKQFNPSFDINKFFSMSHSILKYNSHRNWDSVRTSGTSDKSLCFLSPDSFKMADIYSYRYGLKISPDGKFSIEGGEPDTQIELIDLVKKSIYTFLTSGTPTEYQDGCWYNSSILIVTGCSEIHELRACRPFYYVIDFVNNSVILYMGNVTGGLAARDYIKFKYKIINEGD